MTPAHELFKAFIYAVMVAGFGFLAVVLFGLIGRLVDRVAAGHGLLDRPGRGSCANKRGHRCA